MIRLPPRPTRTDTLCPYPSLSRSGKRRYPARATQDEGARVLAALPKNAQVVALDGHGRQHSSEQLAVRMEHWRGLGRDLAFLVGGPEGHAAAVIARADEPWSLGPPTLPHMLVRLVLAATPHPPCAPPANPPFPPPSA